MASVALVVPAVLLWRQRSRTLQDVLIGGPPVRYHLDKNQLNQKQAHSVSIPPSTTAANSLRECPQESKLRKQSVEDAFNGPLYSLSAFGLATAAVGTVAVAGVWGVKTAMGVDNVRLSFGNCQLVIYSRLTQSSGRRICETHATYCASSDAHLGK